MRDSAAPNPHARALLLGALATLGLTAAHHAYGGIRYDTPWRLHGAVVALGMSPALLALCFPLNRAIGTWTPDALPADWETRFSQMIFRERLRSFLPALAFILELVASKR